MLLSNKDVERIQRLGYKLDYFVRIKKGWLKLKNREERCVFHDGKICLIYDNKPEGCKFYPIIFNEENNSAIIDEDCPYENDFRFNKRDIERLYVLVNQIISERNYRIKNTKDLK